jgi:hypothetical protein
MTACSAQNDASVAGRTIAPYPLRSTCDEAPNQMSASGLAAKLKQGQISSVR